MRRVSIFFCVWLVVVVASACVHADSVMSKQPHITVSLVAELIDADTQRARVGVLLEPDPGWHVYWRNPGDTGLAPSVRWQSDTLIRSTELKWPFPESIPVSHLVNIGYHDAVLLWSEHVWKPLSEIVNSRDIHAELSWLVCKEECVPGNTELSMSLDTISESENSAAKQAFNYWEERIPKPLALMDAMAQITQVNTQSDPVLSVDVYARSPIFNGVSKVDVFIRELDTVVYGEPIKQRSANNLLMWQQRTSEYLGMAPIKINTVIVLDQKTAYAVSVPVSTDKHSL